MAEQEWLRPQPVGGAERQTAVLPATARFRLLPLSLGELLDRTFALYRSRPSLFLAISLAAAVVYTAAQGLSLATMRTLAGHVLVQPGATPAQALANLRLVGTHKAGTYALLLLFFLVSSLTQAATSVAVGHAYLGRAIGAGDALRVALRHAGRYLGVALWQAASAAGPLLAALAVAMAVALLGLHAHSPALVGIAAILALLGAVAGAPLGVVLYLRNALALPAAALENLGVRQAMRRSKSLSAGTRGRIFVVLLIAGCLLEVVAVLQTPAALLLLLAPNQQHVLARALALLVAFVGEGAVAPVALIGLTLVYFDQRVRREGLDLLLLLDEARGVDSFAPGAALGPAVHAASPADLAPGNPGPGGLE